ncbi:MAG: SDR family NAD(P)-dependent oxidoreductase [Pseudomonadota bacterium]
MSLQFDNQVAVVTGAGGGLGRCHALELGRRGAKVVVNDLGDSAERVASEIRDTGGEAIASTANVARFADCEAMVTAAVDQWGRIDVLINNAGILRDKSFGKMDMSDWAAVVDVHLNGSAYCSRAVWNVMKDQGYGRILMTTSSSGIYGNFGQANYGAAKMGLIGLMNTLVIEGAKSGIRVNCLSPTAATAMTEGVLSDDIMAALAPEHVTPAAIYLVSQNAPNRCIMYAGAGCYGVVRISESQGVRLAGTDQTAESLAMQFADIADMTDADHFEIGSDHVLKVIATGDGAG